MSAGATRAGAPAASGAGGNPWVIAVLVALASFGAVRLCPESPVSADVPHPAGSRRRRHGAGCTVDPGGFFPAGERSQAFALFGVAVVVAPAVGPTLGGRLSDNISWHWVVLINGRSA